MSPAVAFAVLVIFVAVVLLESRRQTKRYGRASGSGNLGAAGMLELQKILQADRKVEVMVAEMKKEEAEVDAQGDGTPPDPGGVARLSKHRKRPAG